MLFGVILHGLVVALTFRAGTTRPYEMMLIVLNWLLDVLYEYWFVGAIIKRPQRRAKRQRLRVNTPNVLELCPGSLLP